MSTAAIALPDGTRIAAELDGDGDHVQQSHDTAVDQRLRDLKQSVDAITAGNISLDDLLAELAILDTDVLATHDRLPAALSSGRLAVETQTQQGITASGGIAAANQLVRLPITAGMASFAAYIDPTVFAATLQFEISFNNAVNFAPFAVATGTSSSGQVVTSTSVNGVWYEGAIPPMATHIQIRCSGYTSGTANVILAAGPSQVEAVVAVAGGALTLNASTNRIGFTGASGVWFQDSATALAANGSITAGIRDLLAAAAGTTFNQNTAYGKECVVTAIADQPGTLNVNVSGDNFVSQDHRILSAALSNAATGGSRYIYTFTFPPPTRYVRVNFVNGATAQGQFLLTTKLMAA
jgi:hypothetical protein